jgi:hypothetical protein
VRRVDRNEGWREPAFDDQLRGWFPPTGAAAVVTPVHAAVFTGFAHSDNNGDNGNQRGRCSVWTSKQM